MCRLTATEVPMIPLPKEPAPPRAPASHCPGMPLSVPHLSGPVELLESGHRAMGGGVGGEDQWHLGKKRHMGHAQAPSPCHSPCGGFAETALP